MENINNLSNIEPDNRCSLPFTDMFNISVNTGLSTCCCKIPQTALDPLNGVFNKVTLEVRKAVLDNVRSPHCASCWATIDNGGLSRRSQHSIHESIEWDKIDLFQEPTSVQLKFSDECQLQCVYCGPWSSTTWQNNISEYSNFKGAINNKEGYKVNIDTLLNLKLLKSIQVSGGEPLMSDECVDFLLNLEFNPTRDISLITNLSYGKATLNKLLLITKKHPNLRINASLDAWGKNNISRKYLNWELWKNNFDILIDDLQIRIKSFPTASFRIKCTINSLTYFETPAIIKKIIEYKQLGINGLTFRFGTPFMNELSSLWSDDIDSSVQIVLSEEQQNLLSARELHDIDLFNKMIVNAKLNNKLQEKNKDYLKIYLKDINK